MKMYSRKLTKWILGISSALVFIGCATPVSPPPSVTEAITTTPYPEANTPILSPTVSPTVQAAAMGTAPPSAPKKVRPGIEVLVGEQKALIEGKRIGLITNQSAVDGTLASDVDLLRTAPGATLVALFAGEHGLRGAEKAGKKLEGSIDPYTGVPVYSLYGDTVRPKPEWLKNLDVLIFDIQNVGSALYTYKYTMSFAMEAAAKAGVPFVVLDRPNPIGGNVVEGPMISARDIWRHPLPLRHGMTNGELAAMWNEEYKMGAKLTVVKMEGWRRDMTWEETGLPWVATSPNIPTSDTALAYAGQVLIESVGNVSEARGTTQPFLVTGAPWVDAVAAAKDLNARDLPGVSFRPTYFEPSYPGEKFHKQMSAGVQLYFTDRKAYRAVVTTLSILDAFRKSAGRSIAANSDAPITGLGDSGSVVSKVAKYQDSLGDFLRVRAKYLLY